MKAIDELISVIVPAYSAEEFIARTLESILRQTHQNIEVLVVDDGSMDSTPNIVEAYAEADPRVRLIQQKMAGLHERGTRESQKLAASSSRRAMRMISGPPTSSRANWQSSAPQGLISGLFIAGRR